MNSFVICLGSNLEPRAERIHSALNRTGSLGKIIKTSLIYETPEIHGKGDPYLNMVVTMESEKDVDTLNAHFKKIEVESGRDSICRKKGIVPVDIDIVIFNRETLRPMDFRQSFFQIGWQQIS